MVNAGPSNMLIWVSVKPRSVLIDSARIDRENLSTNEIDENKLRTNSIHHALAFTLSRGLGTAAALSMTCLSHEEIFRHAHVGHADTGSC